MNLTVLEAERILRDHPDRIQRLSREAVIKDKTYQLYPMGMEAAEYLRYKRKRLTASSMRDYESCLDKLARYFTDLELKDFEPPLGTERLEEFLDETWGSQSPRTYNKNLSIIGDFFEKAVLRRKLHGDPTLPIERAKARQVHREIFNGDQRRAIMAANQADRRNRVALRLLLDYGLRKGSLQAVRFEHFDHERKRLTIFAKGGKVRNLPVPDPAFWHDLERLILESEARPFHYLMPRRWANKKSVRVYSDRPMGVHGLHDWWYGCLARAGIVDVGTTRGERMHKARHTAGQRLLDSTGNLVAVKKLLGHASITTTADVYSDWDEEQLAASLADVLSRESEG